MSSDQLKTSVLYQVNNYKVFINEYNEDEKKAIKELLNHGYLRLVSDNLQLTNKGNLIVKSNQDYKSFYLIPTNIPEINHMSQTIAKRDQAWFVKTLNNDWIKLLITGLIVIILGTWLLVKWKIIK
jgi:hypothetical protein